jgi:hypothetical protein
LTNIQTTSIHWHELIASFMRFQSKIQMSYAITLTKRFRPHSGSITTNNAWEVCITRKSSTWHWTICCLESRA